MTSVLNVDTIADKAGTGPVTLTKQQAAKHFVWFDGNTSNAIENSFNTSSVTDVGTGDYKPFLTNSMSTTFSVLHISTYRTSRIKGTGGGTSMTATNAYELDIVVGTDGLTFIDTEVGSSLLGDLA
jgi:hypothetical protein